MVEFFQKAFGDLAKFAGFSLIAFTAFLVCLTKSIKKSLTSELLFKWE